MEVDYLSSSLFNTAQAGSDYKSVQATLAFDPAPGPQTQTIPVAILGDTEPEADETFLVILADPRRFLPLLNISVPIPLANATGRGQILNDDAEEVVGPVNLDAETQALFSRATYNRRNRQYSINVRIENTSSTTITGPLMLVITDTGDPSVGLINADGLTLEGHSFYDLSALLPQSVFFPDGLLAPGAQTTDLTLVLNNPNRRRFTLQTNVIQGDLPATKPVADLPAAYELAQNTPNPFNPDTQIRYQLATAGPVSLVVYNMLGQAVRTLAEGVHQAGTYQVRWDGRDQQGQAQASGLYIYRLVINGQVFSRRMALLK